MVGITKWQWLSQTDSSSESDDSDYDDGISNPGSSTQLPRKRRKSPKSRKSEQKRERLSGKNHYFQIFVQNFEILKKYSTAFNVIESMISRIFGF